VKSHGYHNGKSKYRARPGFAHEMAEVVRTSNIRLVTVEDFDYGLSSTIALKGLEAAIVENMGQTARYLKDGATATRGLTKSPIVVARVNERYIAAMNPATSEVPVPDDEAALLYTPGYGMGTYNAGIYIVKSAKFGLTDEGKRLVRANLFVTEMIEEGLKRSQQADIDLLLTERVLSPKALDRVQNEALARIA
jgi:hypothetical protein